jgi:hypothetical protein
VAPFRNVARSRADLLGCRSSPAGCSSPPAWPTSLVGTVPVLLPSAHYWTAWLTIGAMIAHRGQASLTRDALRSRARRDGAGPQLRPLPSRRRRATTDSSARSGRRHRAAAEPVSPFAQRRPAEGPQGLPVSKTRRRRGRQAGPHPAYCLQVAEQRAPLCSALDELSALPQHEAELQVAASGLEPERDGGASGCAICWRYRGRRHWGQRRRRIPQGGRYRTRPKLVTPVTTTLLALNQRRALHLDHGYPLRPSHPTCRACCRRSGSNGWWCMSKPTLKGTGRPVAPGGHHGAVSVGP